MVIRSSGEDAYFAASNSAKGFFSYYPACFDSARVKRLYAVKGGPGTGKSRFLREVARSGEGNGWLCEYIYCSSDADSLDGIILTKGENCIALLDATAPHVYEPTRPGVREELINLGVFWDGELLASRAEEVEKLTAQKSAAYRRAYRYLCGVGEMSETADELVSPYIRREAIAAFAQKLLGEVEAEQSFSMTPALIRSVGMRGMVGFDTYFAQAKKIVLLSDCHGSASVLMEALGRIASQKKLAVRISHDPICPEKIDGLFFIKSGLSVAVCREEECNYPHKTVSMRRFVSTAKMNPIRDELNYAKRLRRALLDGAIEALEEVRSVHFLIEEIYSSAMNFTAKETFTEIFCRELFQST